jgi:uncharacterized SAM-binding protein YcdF (DUF218 family)
MGGSSRKPGLSLSALPALLALPPLNLLVVSCAGAALRHRRAGRWLLAVGLAGLVLTALPVVSGSLIWALEAGVPALSVPDAPPQAIVILSAEQRPVWTDDTITWRAGPLTLQREAAGAALARRTHLPVLVSGGVLRPDAPSLASTMAASLRDDFAMPVRWQEDASVDTWQNARFSAALLRAQGVTRVYVVTHAWHMRRALVAFRRAGLAAVAAPVQIDAVPEWRASSFVPSVHAWQETYWAVHELVGWAWYDIRP